MNLTNNNIRRLRQYLIKRYLRTLVRDLKIIKIYKNVYTSSIYVERVKGKVGV